MIVLGIDSSSVSAACAVTVDGVTVADGFINNGLTHSQTLLPLISQTLSAARVEIRSIGLLAVTVGPGSFTGLRIGLATAKGIAAPSGVLCAGVSTLLAAAYPFADFDGVVCAVMDARCNQVYCALFEHGERLCPDRAVSIGELKEELGGYGKKILLCGDGAALFHRNAGALPVVLPPDTRMRLISGSSVCLAARCEDAKNARGLVPSYLRQSQAQQKLKGLRK